MYCEGNCHDQEGENSQGVEKSHNGQDRTNQQNSESEQHNYAQHDAQNWVLNLHQENGKRADDCEKSHGNGRNFTLHNPHPAQNWQSARA